MQIKKITAEQTYKLRLAVLKTCDDYIYKYQGDFNDSTTHFAVFEHQENLGIVSLMENKHDYFNGKQLQLRGMAVLKNAQGKGVGQKLIQAFITESTILKADIIWCNARDYSIEFYKKQGFKIEGEKFFIKNVCDHYVMYLQL